MTIMRLTTSVVIAAVLAIAAVGLAETAPGESASSDVQRATHSYLVGVTGMT